MLCSNLICSIHNLMVIALKRRTGMTNYMGYSEAKCQLKPQLCRVSTHAISSIENSEPNLIC